MAAFDIDSYAPIIVLGLVALVFAILDWVVTKMGPKE